MPMKNDTSRKKTRKAGESPGFSSENISMFTGLIHPRNNWEPVNDTVMGGRSHAHAGFTATESLSMHGNLSLENNGGFASVRMRCRLHFDGFHGFRLRVVGDGKRYCLRIKTMNGGHLQRFSYEACFDTPTVLVSAGDFPAAPDAARNSQTGAPSTLYLTDIPEELFEIPFDLFTPVFRGQKMPDAPPLDPSDIGEVALMIKDRQEGPFSLLVNDISSFRPPQADEQQWMKEAIAAADESGTPYGAVIIGPDNQIVSKAGNRVATENDASAHAEIRAIRQAGKKRNSASLSGCRLFSTVEPCPMCMSAAIWAGIAGIYYGATIPDVIDAGGKQVDLRAHRLALRAPDSPDLYEGLYREACKERLQSRL